MVAPITHILPLTTIRRARMLPNRGRVTVRIGQKLSATDVVAETLLPGQHALFNVRRALNVGRNEPLDKLIQVRVGSKLEKGDVIAEKGGLLPRMIRATDSGQVVAINNGQVLVETQIKTLQLLAGISGTVVEMTADLGVTIEGSGALVQGVWGNGKINQGMLLLQSLNLNEDLLRSNLDVSMRGAVVLAGHCSNADALQAAEELPLRGLLLGSMTADLQAVAEKMSYPIILIEGFGHLPLNSAAFKLLSTSERRDICLNAVYNPFSGERPEAFIPLPTEGAAPREVTEFQPGQTLRIQGEPYASMIGKLVRVRPGLTALPNGLRAAAADVILESNKQVIIPLSNLEIID